MEENYLEDSAFVNSLDAEIVMHRDAHFGGHFSLMLDYYQTGGKGAHPDFSLERIEYLRQCEEKLGQNLAGYLLSGIEAEKISRMRDSYKSLRAIYEVPSSSIAYPRLIADLILSEEEVPEKEIQAIVSQGADIVPHLHELLHSDEFLDALAPGYGQAPMLAAICLGRIPNERSVMSLFEALGKGDFLMEERVLEAIRLLEPISKTFLLKILRQLPITGDSHRAALALGTFSLDPEVASANLELLQRPDFQAHRDLLPHMILACEGLRNEAERTLFRELAESELFAEFAEDIRLILKTW